MGAVIETPQRAENFPVSVMRCVEHKLAAARKRAMRRAAEIAASESDGPVYTVENRHVDQAAKEMGLER